MEGRPFAWVTRMRALSLCAVTVQNLAFTSLCIFLFTWSTFNFDFGYQLFGMRGSTIFATLAVPLSVAAQCPDYLDYAQVVHEPLSSGKYKLAYQRPSEDCRTFKSQGVEDTLSRMEKVIKDPDLYRLFQNSYPNTLDTAIKWRGHAADNGDEELTFIITGE
jgi:hypothetical protein